MKESKHICSDVVPKFAAERDYEAECERLKSLLNREIKRSDTLHSELEALKEQHAQLCEKHEYVCTENKRLYEQNLRLERQVDGFVSAARALITRS